MLRYDLRHVRVVLRTDRQGHYCPAWEDRISVQWKFPKFPWFRCVQRAQQGSVLNLMCSFELVLWVAQSAWCVKHIGKDVYAMSAAQRKGSMQSRGRVWELRGKRPGASATRVWEKSQQGGSGAQRRGHVLSWVTWCWTWSLFATHFAEVRGGGRDRHVSSRVMDVPREEHDWML